MTQFRFNVAAHLMPCVTTPQIGAAPGQARIGYIADLEMIASGLEFVWM